MNKSINIGLIINQITNNRKKVNNIDDNDVHAFHLDLKYLDWLNFISKSYYDTPKCCQKKCGVNASKTTSHNHEILRYEK